MRTYTKEHRVKRAMRSLVKARAQMRRSFEILTERVNAKKPPNAKMVDTMLAADRAVEWAVFLLADETDDYNFINKHLETMKKRVRAGEKS